VEVLNNNKNNLICDVRGVQEIWDRRCRQQDGERYIVLLNGSLTKEVRFKPMFKGSYCTKQKL